MRAFADGEIDVVVATTVPLQLGPSTKRMVTPGMAPSPVPSVPLPSRSM